MNKKVLIGLIAIVLAGLGLIFAFAAMRGIPRAAAPSSQEEINQAALPVPNATTTTSTRAIPPYEWILSAAGNDKVTQAPLTRVGLSVDGKQVHELGTYTGSCTEIDGKSGPYPLLKNEKTGVVCWFAGGGDELGIFDVNGKVSVQRGTLDEGSAEQAGFRGNFKTVLAL